MTNKIYRYGLLGIGITLLTGIPSTNWVAAAFIGAGAALLLAVLINLEVDPRIKN